MASRKDLFEEMLGNSSQAAIKRELVVSRANAKRWKQYLAANPKNEDAGEMLVLCEKNLAEIENRSCVTNNNMLRTVETLPFVKSVEVKRGKAVLETKDIMVDWKGRKVNIGNYLMTFRKDQSLPTIRRKQGTVKAGGLGGYYHHPHISSYSESMCWHHDKKTEWLLDEAVMGKRPDIIATIACEILRNPLRGTSFASVNRFISRIAAPPISTRGQFAILRRRLRQWVTDSRPVSLMHTATLRLTRAILLN